MWMVWSMVWSVVEDKNYIYFIQWRLKTTKATPGKKIPPRKFRESSTCRPPSQVHCRWPPSIIISRSFTQPVTLFLFLYTTPESVGGCVICACIFNTWQYPNQDAPVQVGVCVCMSVFCGYQHISWSHRATASASAVQVAAAAPQSNHARTHATSTTTRRVQYREHTQKKRSFPPWQFIVSHTTNSPSPPHSHYDDATVPPQLNPSTGATVYNMAVGV